MLARHLCHCLALACLRISAQIIINLLSICLSTMEFCALQHIPDAGLHLVRGAAVGGSRHLIVYLCVYLYTGFLTEFHILLQLWLFFFKPNLRGHSATPHLNRTNVFRFIIFVWWLKSLFSYFVYGSLICEHFIWITFCIILVWSVLA